MRAGARGRAGGLRILVLSFYFRPDLSAGSFRNSALVDELARRLGPDDAIDVVTSRPNRYASYGVTAPAEEQCGSVRIRRVDLPGHRSGMLDQVLAFTAFAWRARRLARGARYDLVFASSSRLMTAFLAATVARRQGAPLYLDMRDLFPRNMREVLGKWSPARLVLPVLDAIERWTVRRASAVSVVSPGFVEHFRRLDGRKDYRVLTNGIDAEFLERFPVQRRTCARDGERLVLYAGNLGDGQGLHRVVPEAARRLTGRARFLLVGDGGRREALEKATEGMANVEIHPPVPRSELCDLYEQADVLFLHLNDYRAFRLVLPSKIFEYAATGKPILAGVAGCAADFLEREVPGARVFAPCDVDGLERGLGELPPGPIERDVFIERFSRERVVGELAADVLHLVER